MSAGASDSLRSVLFALGANAAIALAKAAGAFFTGSSSMLAEAVHSFADCANQGLLLVGLREAKRPPDADHPLGHGRAIYFWSFIVALMLFSMGGIFSVYEGVHKLTATEPVKHAWIAMATLGFGIAAEGVSLWGCLREVNKERGAVDLWAWFRTSRQSELLVVLAEDVAAMVGLAIALACVALSVVTGNPIWDAIGSIAVGVLLILVAVLVGVEVKALLIGQGTDPLASARMRAHLEREADVSRILNLVTQQLGRDVMVAVKAQLVPLGTDVALIDAINSIEQRFRVAFPQVRWLFFEPDLAD